MKTDTREYTDGTEPDVYRRHCCDGDCQMKPAEACTEVGHEDGGDEAMLDVLYILLKMALVMVVLCVLWVMK